jgi:hypothetical protein
MTAGGRENGRWNIETGDTSRRHAESWGVQDAAAGIPDAMEADQRLIGWESHQVRIYKRGIIGRWLHVGKRSTWWLRRMTGVREKEKIKGRQEGVNTERVIIKNEISLQDDRFASLRKSPDCEISRSLAGRCTQRRVP